MGVRTLIQLVLPIRLFIIPLFISHYSFVFLIRIAMSFVLGKNSHTINTGNVLLINPDIIERLAITIQI